MRYIKQRVFRLAGAAYDRAGGVRTVGPRPVN